MIAILEVSAAIEIVLNRQKAERFNTEVKGSSWVIAPDLFVSEISNVLWKYYRGKLISHYECIEYAEEGMRLVDDFSDSRELWKEALGEGIKSKHSIYDMFYAVLARRNDALLITNDGPLAEICKKSKIAVCF
ncbi:MAG: type II toxin-antitoxin system VapC family toxin [Spirochaetota bacterium]